MQTIQIDEDVFDYLVGKRRGFEGPTETLRRELGILRNSGERVPNPVASGKSTAATFSNPEHKELRDFLQTSEFLVESTVTGRFLSILGWLCRRDSKRFESVLQLSGHSRKYFGRSAQELEERGISVKPQRIPHSSFWADTNNDTSRKKKMLASAMRVLRCSDDTIREAVMALR